jgi:hypothetical protein
MSGTEKVIWKSRWYPEMTMTERQLEMLRYAYPAIPQFEPELRKAEAWLYANPERIPKKNWKAFINNWMRIAEEKVKRDSTRQGVAYGDSARALAKDAVPLKDLLSIAEKKKEQSTDSTTKKGDKS